MTKSKTNYDALMGLVVGMLLYFMLSTLLSSFKNKTDDAPATESSPDLVEEVKKEKGILAKLPPNNGQDQDALAERNIITVRIDEQNTVFLRDQEIEISEITASLKAMIKNESNKPSYPESTQKALVSLRHAVDAKYALYLQVYKAVEKAYLDLWEEKAQALFGQPYDGLDSEKQKQIKHEIPMRISEAEAEK